MLVRIWGRVIWLRWVGMKGRHEKWLVDWILVFISIYFKIKRENAHSVVLVPLPVLLATSEGAGEGAAAGARFLLREGIGATAGGRPPFVCMTGFEPDTSNSGGGGEDPGACMLAYV